MLLGLGERPVGQQPFPVAQPDRGRGVRPGELLGFYLLESDSLDVALDWAAKMPIMRYGTVEVRPVKEGMRWQTAME